MGSVEFVCDCGDGTFLNSTDNRSYMAHCIPDQKYDEFSEQIDEAIENPITSKERGNACMRWRRFPMLKVWQCYCCGVVYIQTLDRKRHRFTPDSPLTPKNLLASKGAD